MGLDPDLLDAWVRDSTPYTAREDQRGLKRRGASRIHSSQDHAANTSADGTGDICIPVCTALHTTPSPNAAHSGVLTSRGFAG